MNKRGQTWAYGLMLGFTIIVLALALAPAGNQFISSAMNQTVGDSIGLDCANESISTFTKGTCIITDFSLAYFFGALIFIGGAVVIARISLGGIE